MGHHQDGTAALGELAQPRHHQLLGSGVQVGGRFVQQECDDRERAAFRAGFVAVRAFGGSPGQRRRPPGPVQQRGQGEALTLAGGDAVAVLAERRIRGDLGIQSDHVQRGPDLVIGGVRGEGLADGPGVGQRRPLGQVKRPPDGDRSRISRVQPGEHPQGRALARPGRSAQRHDLTGPDRQLVQPQRLAARAGIGRPHSGREHPPPSGFRQCRPLPTGDVLPLPAAHRSRTTTVSASRHLPGPVAVNPGPTVIATRGALRAGAHRGCEGGITTVSAS